MNNTRLFKLTDSEAIQAASVMLEHYKKHAADFTAFDSQFDAAWQSAWQQAIEDAVHQPTDEKTLDELYRLTGIVDQKADAALNALDDLKYYVQKAYGADSPQLRTLHFGHPSNLKREPSRLVVKLLVAHDLAQQWQADLTAAGMPAALLNDLQARADELLNAEKEQELFKRQRVLRTAQRIHALNAMWSYVRQVSDAAAIIFRDREELRGLFVVRRGERVEEREK